MAAGIRLPVPNPRPPHRDNPPREAQSPRVTPAIMRSPPSDPLSALLHRADPAAHAASARPPAGAAAFAAAVRARIQSPDTASGPGHRRLSRVFSAVLARQALPLAAALTLLASLAAGTTVAYARENSLRTETFAAAYALSIDPWRMHGPDAAPVPAGHLHP